MIKGLPKNLQEQVIEMRKKGTVFGKRYGNNEIFNEHLDRFGLLSAIHLDKNGEVISGMGNKKIDGMLALGEIDYYLLVLETIQDSYNSSFIKFTKKIKYNKSRENLIKLVMSGKIFFDEDEINKLLKRIPPKID